MEEIVLHAVLTSRQGAELPRRKCCLADPEYECGHNLDLNQGQPTDPQRYKAGGMRKGNCGQSALDPLEKVRCSTC